MSDLPTRPERDPDAGATALSKFWAVTLLHEKNADWEAHEARLLYAGKTPSDGAAFRMVTLELGKRGYWSYKVPDTAYAMGEI